MLRSAGPRQARARGTAQHVQLYLASPPPPFGRSRMTVPLVIHARVAFSPDRPPCHPLSLPWPSRRTVKLFSVWGPFESLRGPLNVGVLHGDAHLVHSRPGHVLKRSWSVSRDAAPRHFVANLDQSNSNAAALHCGAGGYLGSFGRRGLGPCSPEHAESDRDTTVTTSIWMTSAP